MAGLERYNPKTVVQRIGNDTVYGGGQDGTVVISSNTSLSRDMYYNNLTINSGVHLNTNGWKVFVKGTLTLNGSIGIKSTDATVSGATSLAGHTTANTAVAYSIGGSTQTNSATQLPATIFYDLDKAVNGYYIDSASTARVVQGGAGGPAGANGTLDTDTAAPTTWTGKAGGTGGAGSAGSAGSNGQYPPNATTVGQPGGRGNTGATGNAGSDGTPGTAGTAGTSGTAGTGGTGGVGGAVVLIVAKTVTGSGTIFSQGKTGSTGTAAVNGTTGSAGSAGSAGSTGATGATGTKAPDGPSYPGHVNSHSHARPTHHGGGDTLTTSLPHFHNPHYHTHGYKHHDHYIVDTGYDSLNSTPYTHTYSHNPGHSPTARPADHFTHRGGVDHNHYGTHNPTGGTHGSFAHMYDHGHHGHADPGHNYSTKFTSGHTGHRYYQDATAWVSGPALQSYSYHADYPGGAGGAGGAGGTAGTAGLAGPGGRAGTPTAGADGYPGGGGGLVLVTDTTPASVVYNTSGATSGGYTSASGMQVIVLNA